MGQGHKWAFHRGGKGKWLTDRCKEVQLLGQKMQIQTAVRYSLTPPDGQSCYKFRQQPLRARGYRTGGGRIPVVLPEVAPAGQQSTRQEGTVLLGSFPGRLCFQEARCAVSSHCPWAQLTELESGRKGPCPNKIFWREACTPALAWHHTLPAGGTEIWAPFGFSHTSTSYEPRAGIRHQAQPLAAPTFPAKTLLLARIIFPSATVCPEASY